jgi:1,4-dihydroxy-2-naphthoate octaprenyltransferase
MIRSLIRLSRPVTLLLAAMTYTLGAGIAHYLGRSIEAGSFGLGLLSILALQAAAFMFDGYFRLPQIPLTLDETRGQREQYREILLQVSYAALTLSAVAILILQISHLLSLSAALMLAFAFFILIAYAIPPIRLSGLGYGELIHAGFLGTIIPAVAFLLQSGELHRLLSITTFPLTLLALAFLLVLDFPTYAIDQKMGIHTLLTRLTWQKAIPVHHFLVFATFIFYSAAPLLGYPWSLLWPVFLAMPFTIIQVVWLQSIANGGRTLWNFLAALAVGTFGLTVYLLTITFWIR